MPENFAARGSWTNVTPPSALIARSPSVPSEPVPDSTTPIAWVVRSAASALKKKSIGRCGPRISVGRGTRLKVPLRIPTSALEGIT